MIDAQEYGYFSKDVAKELDVTTSTLRRWSISLEEYGYTFDRNDKKQRIYFERDFEVFRRLQKLLSQGIPYIDAMEITVKESPTVENAEKTPSVQEPQMRPVSLMDIPEFKELLDIKKEFEELKQSHNELVKKLEDRNKRDERLDQRLEERDQRLMETLRQITDTQKQIAASQPKKKWWQFWS